MAEYTEGEWELDETGTAIFSGERLIANCGGYVLTQHEPESLDENKANAYIMVASKDMYEALKELDGWWKSTASISDIKSIKGKVREALLKAEGRGGERC